VKRRLWTITSTYKDHEYADEYVLGRLDYGFSPVRCCMELVLISALRRDRPRASASGEIRYFYMWVGRL